MQFVSITRRVSFLQEGMQIAIAVIIKKEKVWNFFICANVIKTIGVLSSTTNPIRNCY